MSLPAYKRNFPSDIDGDPDLESDEFYLQSDVGDQYHIDFPNDDSHLVVINGFAGHGIWLLRGFDEYDEHEDREIVLSLTISANGAIIFTPDNLSDDLQNALIDLWEHQGDRFGDTSLFPEGEDP